MVKDPNIVVISLAKAPERRKKIVKQIDDLGIQGAYIMNAFDGDLLSEEEKDKHIKIGRWRVGEKFKPGEIGCTMSHIEALKVAKENGWPSVIVLEDDVVLAKDFLKRLKLLDKLLPWTWEHVYLSGIPGNPPPPTGLMFPNIAPSDFTECTHSMMINGAAYDKIIDKLGKFETTTDDIYCDMIRTKSIESYTYYPFVTYANDEYTYIWNQEISREHKSKAFFREGIL